MRRQAIETTPGELIKKAYHLMTEGRIDIKQKVQLNIINKHKTSDTWRFE